MHANTPYSAVSLGNLLLACLKVQNATAARVRHTFIEAMANGTVEDRNHATLAAFDAVTSPDASRLLASAGPTSPLGQLQSSMEAAEDRWADVQLPTLHGLLGMLQMHAC